MDENVIFSKPELKPSSSAQPSGNIPVEESSKPLSTQESSTPETPSGPPNSPPLPKPPPASSFGGIFKIFVIVFVLLIIGAVAAVFILPRLGKSAKEGTVTLTYWGLFEDKRVMETIINDFHRDHPTITINYVQKDIKNYRQSLITQINNNNGPDMYRFHNSWVGMMKPYLAPMSSDVLSVDDLKNNYYPVIQQDLVRNGGLYGIPLGIDTLSLFVNSELFEAGGNSIPKTWDEFIRVAKDRVVKDSDGKIKTAGASMGTFDNINHAPDIVALLMAQNGTNFANFSSTIPNAGQALEFYAAFAKDEGSVWDSTLDPSLVAFAKGNLAMYFGYSWDIFAMKALNPDLKFSVHPVPNLPGRKMAYASYWVEGVSAKSSHQKEAMLFMQYLTKKETLQKLFTETSKTRAFGEPYPRKDLAETVKNNPLLSPFLEQAAYATSSYFASDTYDDGINTQMNAYLGNAVRLAEGNGSGESAAQTLAQGVNQVLAKYGK